MYFRANTWQATVHAQAFYANTIKEYTVILEKFTFQNFQFKIIQPKKFSSLKVIDENFYGCIFSTM